MHYFTFQQHVVAVNVAAAEYGPNWLLSLGGTAEAWGPSGRRVMESFQAYLFKTSAYLNATWGFREFGFLLPDRHSSEMCCSWDHAHAPSVLSYLLLTPNRAGSQSVSRGWREGSFIFDHLWTTRWVALARPEWSSQSVEYTALSCCSQNILVLNC